MRIRWAYGVAISKQAGRPLLIGWRQRVPLSFWCNGNDAPLDGARECGVIATRLRSRAGDLEVLELRMFNTYVGRQERIALASSVDVFRAALRCLRP